MAVPDATMLSPEERRRQQRAWYVYDWANSAFSTTVVTLFFGPYLTTLARRGATPTGGLELAGLELQPAALWPFLISLSVLSQLLLLPWLGAVADATGRKRELLAGLAFTGATATSLMYWLKDDRWALGCGLFLIANLCFGASVTVYNAFLPQIALPAERDAVSSNGWGLGYLGGGLLLALNLWLYQNVERIGWSQELAVRVSLCSAGLWWGLFALVPVVRLRNPSRPVADPPGTPIWRAGCARLVSTLRQLPRYPQSLRFLIAFLFYNDAIQTVITLAAQFGQEELGLGMEALTLSILLAQLVAFPGALAFKNVAAWIGNQRAVLLTLAIWSAILVYVYAGVHSEREFYWLAASAGAVMGASQALSRSVFSFLIPKGHEAAYFSLYEITDKGTSWVAPLLFGIVLQLTGRYRLAVLSLLAFFLIGMFLLARVDLRRGAQAAGNEPPPKC